MIEMYLSDFDRGNDHNIGCGVYRELRYSSIFGTSNRGTYRGAVHYYPKWVINVKTPIIFTDNDAVLTPTRVKSSHSWGIVHD